MYKIEYRNTDGTGPNGTDMWISDPVPKERLEAVLEKMRSNGCSIVNIIDMRESVYLTEEEMQMIHAACTYYGEKLSQVIRSFPDEKPDIFGDLSARAAEFYRLAGKVTRHMEDAGM